eukprot:UN06558
MPFKLGGKSNTSMLFTVKSVRLNRRTLPWRFGTAYPYVPSWNPPAKCDNFASFVAKSSTSTDAVLKLFSENLTILDLSVPRSSPGMQ